MFENIPDPVPPASCWRRVDRSSPDPELGIDNECQFTEVGFYVSLVTRSDLMFYLQTDLVVSERG
jgi:hypothetical protein